MIYLLFSIIGDYNQSNLIDVSDTAGAIFV